MRYGSQKYLIYSRYVEFLLFEFILSNGTTKRLTNDPFTRKQIGKTINDVIKNGPYNSCAACVVFEYERAYKILPAH